jgi:hypothetical protein
MVHAKLIVVAVATLMAITDVPELQTLRELARKQGSVEQIVHTEYRPTTLTELAATADLVIEGRIGPCVSNLTADERSINTDCAIQVLQTLKGDIALGEIKLRRPGGTVYLEGRKVTVTADGSPVLAPDSSYIFFLKSDSGSRTYSILFGPQGTLSVQNGVVTKHADLGPDEEIASMSLEDFRTTLQDLIARPHK